MKKINISALAAVMAFSGTKLVADQTSHVYGLHDRSANQIAFTNATIVTEPGKELKNATLIIDDGRIVSVKSGGKVPAGAKVVDLSSHVIYPGFVDAYSNYVFGEASSTPSWGDPPKYQGDRKGGDAWNDAIHAQVNWVTEFKADPKASQEYIKNGFTAVQTAKLDGIFQGQGVTVSLANGLPNELMYNAQARHFGSFNKGSSKQSYPSSLMGSIALIRQTLADASWYQSAQGKTDTLITGEPVEYNAALASLSELKSSGLMFNPDDSLSIMRADRLFDSYNIDVVYLADGHEYARINDIKAANVSLAVTPDFPDKPDVSSYEAQLDVNLAELRHWERAPSNPAVLAQHKIPFSFTQYGLKKKSDFWKNIKVAIKHGLSETDALAALTTVPAQQAGIAGMAGKIAPGMMADFVIADGNLFDDGKIKQVYLQGEMTEIEPLAPTQFAGKYALNIGSVSLTLELSQKDNKVSGKFLADDKKSSIKVHEQFENQLQFSSELSDLGLAGVHRFSSRLIDNSLTGFYVTNTPEKTAFSATKSPVEGNNEEKSDKDEAAVEYVSSLTYPNRAFGLNQPPKQQNVHIKNATVWTSEQKGILQNSDIIIRNGKIDEVGKNLNTPRGYQVIDATGKHVTAGIIDEHSHIAISKGVNEGSDAITAEVRIGDVLNPEDINIYRAMAGGTTSAQLLHGSANPIGGQAQVIKLRWGTNAEGLKFKQAPGSIKFALGENVKQSNWGDKFTIRYPQTRMGVETIVRDAFLRAQEYKAAFEKYDDLSRSAKKRIAPPRRNYRMDALVEILESKRFVHSHSYVASEILSLMNIAEDFGFRIQTFTHILEGYKVADEMAKHGASASTFADWWAYKFEVYDAIPGNTCLMMKNGVNVSVNSDSGDLIRRLNTEAAKSINYCDMSEEDAIKMVTINPAKQLKIDKYTGSLREGKDADLVIWSGHPLSIYSKVEQTWIDGRKYFDREQDALLREQLMNEKSQLIKKVLSNGKKPTDNKDIKDNDDDAKASHSPSKYFLMKHEAEWHCEDNFDFWQWQKQQSSAATHQEVQ